MRLAHGLLPTPLVIVYDASLSDADILSNILLGTC